MSDVEATAAVKRGGDRPEDPQLETIGQELHATRRKRRLSLEQLAERSGVSRSMISKIERREAVPSTTVLAKLAEALGLTFSQLMSQPVEREVIVIKAARQPVLRDEATGFTRRCLSPVLPGRGIDWVLNTLPPRGATGEFGAHRRGVEEYIYVLKGRLKAVIGTDVVTLDAGDSLYFQADANHAFTNIGAVECTYFLVIDSARLRA
jgi:transcriptional regulator with XRE-family HTH domain